MKLNFKKIQSLAGALLSLVLLLLIYFMLDWQRVGQELKQVQFLYIILGIIIVIIQFITRSIRWRYLLQDQEPPLQIMPALDALMIGNLATFVLPLRAGEFIRSLVLTRFTKRSFSSVLVSVVIERFFDLICVLLCFALVVVLVPNIPEIAYKGAFGLAGLALAIFLFILTGSFFPEALMRLATIFLRLLPNKISLALEKFLSDLLAGTVVLKNFKNLLLIIIWTAIVWSLGYLSMSVFAVAFGLKFSFLLGLTSSVVLALAVALPSSPGFLGVYQWGCIAAFALFNLDRELAVAFSLVTHALQYLLFILYGIWAFWRRGISWQDLKNSRS